MRIAARAMKVGDVIHLHDWNLHVVAVEHDFGTAVLTSEFGFLMHFGRDQTVDVVSSVGAPPSAA